MNYIDNLIKNSFFYNFIIYIIEVCSKTKFLSAGYHAKGHKIRPYRSLIHRTIARIDLFMDRLISPINKKIKSSFTYGFFLSFFDFLWQKAKLEGSFFARLILNFKFIYILIFYPLIDYFLRYYVSSLSGIWDEAFFLFMVLLWFAKRILREKHLKFSKLDLPLIAFILTYFVIFSLVSPDLNVAIDGLRVNIQYIFWFFIVFQELETSSMAKNMVYIGTSISLLIGLHAIYQFFSGVSMLGNWVDSSETITTRAYSILLSPNLLGSFFVLFLPIAFSLFLSEKTILGKLFFLFVCLVDGLALIFTFSRGAWLAAFVALVLFFIFTYRQLLLAMTVAAAGLIVALPPLSNRFFKIFTSDYLAKSSAGGRLYRSQRGMEMLRLNPWLGVGMGRFGGAVAINYGLAKFYMDNYYMKTLVETGIIGLAAMLILFALMDYYMIEKINSLKNTRNALLTFGILAGLNGLLFHNLFENIFESPLMVTFFYSFSAIIMAFKEDEEKG